MTIPRISPTPPHHSLTHENEASMSVENAVGLIVAVTLLVYLIIALIKPEKF
ncbi:MULTISPECIES: K(+)-transporting ATPase subunit F [Streptomyces]|uniref:K(+)-transporting ATPase subunit F n=1 Tax=Streptomyces kaempferi TaxID=333725 RepID=A0ABW3XFZ5_9ACTN|nr:K(+)-transporting ATPase subunit F [Streptomyces sp. NBC_01462]